MTVWCDASPTFDAVACAVDASGAWINFSPARRSELDRSRGRHRQPSPRPKRIRAQPQSWRTSALHAGTAHLVPMARYVYTPDTIECIPSIGKVYTLASPQVYAPAGLEARSIGVYPHHDHARHNGNHAGCIPPIQSCVYTSATAWCIPLDRTKTPTVQRVGVYP